MERQSDAQFGSRDRRRLEAARENGYLDGRCRESPRVVKAYGLWCWRLKIPLVWFERRSPRSRYGRVRLDMFTTANMLTAGGQAAMRAMGGAGPAEISPHDALWDRVPMHSLGQLANAALRAAVRRGNYEPNRVGIVSVRRRKPARVLELWPARAASA